MLVPAGLRLEKSESPERDETRKNLLARAEQTEERARGPASMAPALPQAAADAGPAQTVNLPEDAPSLPPKERALYKEARALFAKGDARGAHEKGQPLFKAFPADAAVVELRCQAALAMHLSWEKTRAECGALVPR